MSSIKNIVSASRPPFYRIAQKKHRANKTFHILELVMQLPTIPSMPFKILALAPFCMNNGKPWTQPPVSVNNMNLDAVMEKLELSNSFSIPTDLCPAGGIDLRFAKLKDFHPDTLIQNASFLTHLLEAKSFLIDAKVKNLSMSEKREELKKWPDLPSIHIKSEKIDSKPNLTSPVDSILSMISLPGEGLEPSSRPQSESVQIEAILQQALSHIFGHKNFRTIEAAWRGVKLLLQECAVGRDVKLDIVPVALNTLEQTLGNLMPKLIDRLPSLIIVDLPFDSSSFCVDLLKIVSEFAETLLVPVIVWVTPRFLKMESWNDLNKRPFIPHYLEESAFAKWQSLKKQPTANWLIVTCNRFLVRYPYGNENRPRKFQFHEHQPLWIAPVWAVSSLIAKSFLKFGWPTRMTDWRNIRVENLALNTKDPTTPLPTEVSFSEDRIDQFRRAGILPLAVMPDKDIVFTPVETTAAGSSLNYQLIVSRIAQLILWYKDNLPEELSGEELEVGLKQAFVHFWEMSGHTEPVNLIISAGQPKPDNRIPLHIEVQPSRKILPSGENIVLEFFW